MPYNKFDDYQKRFARWVNHRAIFKTVKWEDYGKILKNKQADKKNRYLKIFCLMCKFSLPKVNKIFTLKSGDTKNAISEHLFNK